MLRYLGYGQRSFGIHPMYVHRRMNWEFFAVYKGRCAPVLEQQPEPSVLVSRSLWVFPPDTAHGWSGHLTAACEVAVFHYSTVPSLLERSIGMRGYLHLALTPAQARWLAHLAAEINPHFQQVNERSLLMFDRALLELSLLAINSSPQLHTSSTADFAVRKVENCLTWYEEHMENRPKLDEVAAAANISVRHLRRLFQEVRNESPQIAFTKLRINRAMEMLSRSDAKLEVVAAECGFASGSDFSRVFRSYRKVSPDTWRKQHLRECSRLRAEEQQ